MIKFLPLDIFWIIFIALLSYGLGRKILSKIKNFNFPNRGLNLAFCIGFGLVILSYLTFLLGFLGLIYKWLFVLILFLLLVYCRREIKNLVVKTKSFPDIIQQPLTGKFDYFILFVLGVAIISNFIFNYSPPTQAREMLYDLTAPKLYIENHKIVDLPYQKEFFYPMQIQMLYLLAMTIHSVMLAKMIHFLFGILSLIVVFSVTKSISNPRAALFSAVIFYLMPVITSVSGTANIDLGQLFYGLLSTTALLLWIQSGHLESFLIAAFLAGITFGSKVTGISMVVTLFVFSIFWMHYKKVPTPTLIKRMGLAGLLIAIGFSPWIFRNMMFTGNPLAPFSIPFLGLSGHELADLEMSQIKEMGLKLNWKMILSGHHNFLFGDFIFGWGPLLFAFVLPAFYSNSSKLTLKVLTILAAINFMVLYLLLKYPHIYYENRYYIISYSIISILSGIGADFVRTTVWNKKSLYALVSICLIFPCLTFSLLFGLRRLPLFLGLQSQDQYLERKLPFYPAIKSANAHFSDSGIEKPKVLMIGSNDAHLYYWDAQMITPPLSLFKEFDTEKILSTINDDEITHILYFKDFYIEPPIGGILKHINNDRIDLYWDLEDLNANFLTKVHEDKALTLYKLKTL